MKQGLGAILSVVALCLLAAWLPGWAKRQETARLSAPVKVTARVARPRPAATGARAWTVRFPGIPAGPDAGARKAGTVALPSPWVDTGVRKTITLSGKASLWAAWMGDTDGTDVSLLGFNFAARVGPHDGSASVNYGVSVPELSVPGTDLDNYAIDVFGDWSTNPMSPAYAVTREEGPYILGCRRVLIDGHADHYPKLSQCCYRQEYAWFADESTEITLTGPGSISGTIPHPSGVSGPALIGAVIGTVSVSIRMNSATQPSIYDHLGAQITDLTLDGTLVDTSGIDESNSDGLMHGLGDGDIDCRYWSNMGGTSLTTSISASIPYDLTFDVSTRVWGADYDVIEFTDGVRAGNQTMADNGSVELLVASWEPDPGTVEVVLTVDSAYAAGHSPPLDSYDLNIGILDTPPIGGVSFYEPVTLSLGEVSVHRPDGAKPSEWATSDGAKITVSEAAGASTFTVAATGAHVTRTLATLWEHAFLDDGNGYRTLFGVTAYERTKHLTAAEVPADLTAEAPHGEDVWCWPHAWLRLAISAPSAGTLTLAVTHTPISVDDPHATSARAPSYTGDAATASYSVPVSSGANTVWIDLLLPTGATAPLRLGRVSALALSGFAVGEYVLSAADLVPVRLTDSPQVALSFSGIRRRGFATDGLTAEQIRFKTPYWPCIEAFGDGAAWWENEPDTVSKEDMTGVDGTGGARRYVEPMEGSGTGVLTDAQLTLSGLADKLNGREGVTASYDASAYAAACKDSYDVELGGESADWLWELIPPSAGASLSLKASPRCRALRPCNAHGFAISALYDVGAGMRALVLAGGARAAAGVQVDAMAQDDPAGDPDQGVSIANADTDASGFALVGGFVANNSRQVVLTTTPGAYHA